MNFEHLFEDYTSSFDDLDIIPLEEITPDAIHPQSPQVLPKKRKLSESAFENRKYVIICFYVKHILTFLHRFCNSLELNSI